MAPIQDTRQRLIDLTSDMLELGFEAHPTYDMDPLIEGMVTQVYPTGVAQVTLRLDKLERLVALAKENSNR